MDVDKQRAKEKYLHKIVKTVLAQVEVVLDEDEIWQIIFLHLLDIKEGE